MSKRPSKKRRLNSATVPTIEAETDAKVDASQRLKELQNEKKSLIQRLGDIDRECRQIYSDAGFEICIKTLTGKVVNIQVFAKDTILTLKEKFQDSQGIPPDQQTLIFGGKQLMDMETLELHNIQPESILHLVTKLSGS